MQRIAFIIAGSSLYMVGSLYRVSQYSEHPYNWVHWDWENVFCHKGVTSLYWSPVSYGFLSLRGIHVPFHYSRVFVIWGFFISGYHCITIYLISLILFTFCIFFFTDNKLRHEVQRR